MTDSTCVIIPIKLRSERLPGKNLRDLCGKPLYAYLFDALKKTMKVDEVYIDCSDDEMLAKAETGWGYKGLKRPEELNSNSATGDDLLQRVARIVDFDNIGWLHVTSPFLSPASIDKGIDTLVENADLDSVFGVAPRYNRFWFNGKEINHSVDNLIGTQDLNPVLEEADVYFFKRESFLQYGKRVCGNFQYYEIPATESVDIDNFLDFVFAEATIKSGQLNYC